MIKKEIECFFRFIILLNVSILLIFYKTKIGSLRKMCVRRSLFILSNISHTCSLANLLLKGRKKKFNFTRVRHSTENATFPSNLCRTRLCRKWQQLSRLFYSYRRGDRVCRKKDTRARCLNCKGPLTNGAAAGTETGEVEERVTAKSAHRFR